MKRTETREQSFRLIYSIEIQKEMDEEQVQLFMQENGIEEKAEIAMITGKEYVQDFELFKNPDEFKN